MHDVRAIRDAPDTYVAGWSRRGVADAAGVVRAILNEDGKLRAAKTRFEQAQAERNAKSKLIGVAKARRDEAAAVALMAEVEALKATLSEAEAGQKAAEAALNGREGMLAKLPNLAAEGVPEGEDEAGNVEVKRWRDPAATPAGAAGLSVDHATLGERLRLMDFEAAARMSGARFVVLRGDLARLERALGQFMLDVQTREHGYEEVSPPLLVRDDALFGTGQLPKFESDLFLTDPRSQEWTSAVSKQLKALGRTTVGEISEALEPQRVRDSFWTQSQETLPTTSLLATPCRLSIFPKCRCYLCDVGSSPPRKSPSPTSCASRSPPRSSCPCASQPSPPASARKPAPRGATRGG